MPHIKKASPMLRIGVLRNRLLPKAVYSTVRIYVDDYRTIQTSATNSKIALVLWHRFEHGQALFPMSHGTQSWDVRSGNRQHEQTGSYMYMSQRPRNR